MSKNPRQYVPIMPSDIDRWCASPSEHERLEFKEAKAQFSIDRLFEYFVAIANEGGGHLILGISDSYPRQIVGTRALSNPFKVKLQALQKLHFRVALRKFSTAKVEWSYVSSHRVLREQHITMMGGI